MQIQNLPIGNIKPYATNPRKNAKAIETVAKSIEQFGFQQPIVVDKNMSIVVGHTRYAAAQKLNLQIVPVLVADTLTDAQVKQYRIMDNRSNENAKWDEALLFDELQTLLVNDDIVQLSTQTGFTESELNKLFKSKDEPDLSKYLNPMQPRSKTGDVWVLGDHRLVNGSSVDVDDVKSLFKDKKADMIWEDPPYGVAYQTVNGINFSKEENALRNHKIANDSLTPEQLDAFLMQHVKVMNEYIKSSACIYWCHDIRFNEAFKQVLEAHKYHIADTLIWKKNTHSTFIGVDYAKLYEPILYGWKEGKGKHQFNGTNMQRNVIDLNKLQEMDTKELIAIIGELIEHSNYQEFAREPKSIASLHPTVKPAALISYHLINSSKEGDIVYDGFSGSGSTLIAATRTKRKAYCIELEPKFVDVTIARWQEETSMQAYRESDNVKWDDLDQSPDIQQNLTALFDLTPEQSDVLQGVLNG